ncbi:MAG: glycoside hydrolase family 2 [Clostridiales bacterium]|nr:glycoside hydrolase family 2 [Clostridiales bacterium]
MTLKTRYNVGETPHSQHPFPQAKRENWLCLNGKWNLQKLRGESVVFDGKILVPFSPETLLSGIENFRLESGETLVYSRSVVIDERFLNGAIKLHFGAVDSEAEVFFNGEKVAVHRGGFTAFSTLLENARAGENELVVKCRDEGTRNGGAFGKQKDKRGGIWYTPQSGIWQTVWLEFMPKTHITGLRFTPNFTDKNVRVQSNCGDEWQKITVYDNGTEILRERYQSETDLRYDFEPWSPENPKLYDCVITSATGDKIESYFAFRAFGKTRDEQGVARLTLNGKPYFFNGVLDQGYWSDGMLTYPCDQAAWEELKLLKDMGFNTVRKHIKIEPMRWYYHCDRLGLVVWQDFVNGGGDYKWSHIALLPFLGFKHRDDDYAYFARNDADGRAEFAHAVDETVSKLYNCPCIGLWTIFNEGWGQFDSAHFTEYVRSLDNTRIIDSVSGWHDQGVGKTELKSLHTYYTLLRVPKDSRPVVLSEFGGYSMKCAGHVFDEEKEFGYKKFRSFETLGAAVEKLYLKKVLPLIKKGLCGCIYTQVSDVEEEINGLVTYDREIVKIPVEFMKKINAEITAEANKVK